jgi:hypothetical protein
VDSWRIRFIAPFVLRFQVFFLWSSCLGGMLRSFVWMVVACECVTSMFWIHLSDWSAFLGSEMKFESCAQFMYPRFVKDSLYLYFFTDPYGCPTPSPNYCFERRISRCLLRVLLYGDVAMFQFIIPKLAHCFS